MKLTEPWDDYLLTPGREWDEIIESKLHEAQVYILLVSKHFLASEYIRDKELPVILKKYQQNKSEVRVIPILLDQCGFEASPLSHLQAIPEDEKKLKPVTEWDDIQKAYFNIRDKLLLAFLELLINSGSSHSVLPSKRLSDLLTKLNFHEPKIIFDNCLSFGYSTFVFLVHGEKDAGHNWFLRIVLRRWFMHLGKENFKLIHLSLDQLEAIDLVSICEELFDKNEFKNDEFDSIINDFCQWASIQPVVFRIDGIEDVSDEDISVLIEKFCKPLIGKIESAENVRHKVILFFVKPKLHPEPFPFAEYTKNFQLHTPVMLPGLNRLEPGHLQQWIEENVAEIWSLDKKVEKLIRPDFRAGTIEEIIRVSRGRIEGRTGVVGALAKLYDLEYQKILDQLPHV